MRILKLAVAFALALSSLTIVAAPADAQRGRDRWERGDYNRDGYRGDRRRWRGDRRWRDDRGRRGWRGDRWRRDRWRYSRSRYGWRGRSWRNCRWVWRYGHRRRICWRR